MSLFSQANDAVADACAQCQLLAAAIKAFYGRHKCALLYCTVVEISISKFTFILSENLRSEVG